MTPGGDTQSGVLNNLESVEVRVRKIRGPNRGGVIKRRTDKGFERRGQELLGPAPGCSGSRFQDVQIPPRFRGNHFGVLAEGERRVKLNTQEFGVFVKFERSTVDGDWRLEMAFCWIEREEGDGRFVRRDGEVFRSHPLTKLR